MGPYPFRHFLISSSPTYGQNITSKASNHLEYFPHEFDTRTEIRRFFFRLFVSVTSKLSLYFSGNLLIIIDFFAPKKYKPVKSNPDSVNREFSIRQALYMQNSFRVRQSRSNQIIYFFNIKYSR